MEGNLLIKDGVIIDGKRRDAFRGDVVVAEDKIEAFTVSDRQSVGDSAAVKTVQKLA